MTVPQLPLPIRQDTAIKRVILPALKLLPAAMTSIEAIVIYVDTGTEATSPLIAYIDTATGLPITPNGGDIIVTWDNGVNKIFKV